MIRKGLRPRLRFGVTSPGANHRYAEVFPLRRSWPAIAILLVLDVVFLIPAISTFQEAVSLWRQPEDLFNLVAALFITFWLLGWSLAPILMTALLIALLFGRESVQAGQGYFEISLGLPRVGMTMRYEPARMRNLRIEYPEKGSGKSWRGPHLAFDYGANSGEFGSGVSEQSLEPIRACIERATGITLRDGEATAEELAGAWETAEEQRAPATPKPAVYDRIVQDDAVSLTSGSTLALIAANLIPFAGAVFMGWDLGLVLVLYWAESAIIGFYNLLKIVVIGRWMALPAGIFFLAHFGGFMAGHFLFLYTFFIEGLTGGDEAVSLDEVTQMFYGLWPALAALFLSHGYSFLRNFIGHGEYRLRAVKDQMSEPYSRIVFMHLVIIFGGGLTLALGEPTPVLLLVIGLKILLDVRAHLREHRRD
jgi:hypothetical protein